MTNFPSKKPNENNNRRMAINGTEARQMLLKQKSPPAWYMRPEISKMIIDSLKAKEEVFIN